MEITTLTGADRSYQVARVENLDAETEDSLLADGWRFLDRKLRMQISGNKAGIMEKKSMPALSVQYGMEFPEDMYQLAYSALTTDRRFHLKPLFDQNEANGFIRTYIDHERNLGSHTVRVLHDGELLGFSIVRTEQAGIAENVLAATKPCLQGKLAVPALYGAMLNINGGGYILKYEGNVSSTNLASLNLHIRLGARVTRIFDEYVRGC